MDDVDCLIVTLIYCAECDSSMLNSLISPDFFFLLLLLVFTCWLSTLTDRCKSSTRTQICWCCWSFNLNDETAYKQIRYSTGRIINARPSQTCLKLVLQSSLQIPKCSPRTKSGPWVSLQRPVYRKINHFAFWYVTNLTHNFFYNMFIWILHMFQATMCLSSGGQLY
jgi:hypothetical protein